MASDTAPGAAEKPRLGIGTIVKHMQFGAGRIVAYEPGRRFEYASTAGPIGFAGHYTFAPTAGGTRFTSVDETTPPGLLRRLAPLLRPLAQRQIARNLARLKAVLEAGAA